MWLLGFWNAPVAPGGEPWLEGDCIGALSAGLVLGLCAEVAALGDWLLVVLAVGGAMVDGMFLGTLGGDNCEDGNREMGTE